MFSTKEFYSKILKITPYKAPLKVTNNSAQKYSSKKQCDCFILSAKWTDQFTHTHSAGL